MKFLLIVYFENLQKNFHLMLCSEGAWRFSLEKIFLLANLVNIKEDIDLNLKISLYI